jgi:pimeloyl-ACP methyl ester carboxylesterase
VLSACGTTAPSGALTIARQGYFFVGGRYVATAKGHVMDGQMFVQYQVPAHRAHAYPVVLVHGQGQSGTNFLGTPDGREGWADYFLRRGYAVYVVDQAMRGRSAYHPDLDGPLSPFTADNDQNYFTHPEEKAPWAQAHLHDEWPGGGVMGDTVFDQFYASQVESTSDLDVAMDNLNREDLVALLEKIGPSFVLTHSRSGAFGWLVGDARPELVRGVIAVEPWGPPFGDVSPAGKHPRPWGLTVAPLAYSPQVNGAEGLQPRKDGDCWVLGVEGQTLPGLGRVPVLLVTGEASYHMGYDHCTVEFLTAAGVHVRWMQLGEIGIHGNAHMMMLEKNNREIAGAIEGWMAGVR